MAAPESGNEELAVRPGQRWVPSTALGEPPSSWQMNDQYVVPPQFASTGLLGPMDDASLIPPMESFDLDLYAFSDAALRSDFPQFGP